MKRCFNLLTLRFNLLKRSFNLLKSSNNFFFLRFNLRKQGFIFYLSLFMEIGIYFDKENGNKRIEFIIRIPLLTYYIQEID